MTTAMQIIETVADLEHIVTLNVKWLMIRKMRTWKIKGQNLTDLV